MSDIVRKCWASPIFFAVRREHKDLICDAVVLELGRTIKDAVMKQGMLAWQYNTIGVSDAITMGGEGTFVRSKVALTGLIL